MRSKSKKLFFYLSTVGIVFLLGLTIFFSFFIYWDTSSYYRKTYYDNISIRKFPYPFRAALTLCSDIDATDSLREFLTIQEFLNTKNHTVLGKGIGLEIGNSFFPVRSNKKKFSLMSDNPHDQEVIIDLIHLGYIDFIHSFNSAKNRQEIKRILEVLSKNNCKLDVWVNHAKAPSDLGPCKWCLGDNPDSSIYHSDISKKKLGYIFVWMGDISSILGQGRPLTLTSFFDAFDKSHPFQSLINNVFKEIGKYILSVLGSEKYAMRRYNDLVTVSLLDDGQKVFKFMRSGIAYYGIGKAATAKGLSDIIRKDSLKKLVSVGGYMIIYTHLGKNQGYPYLPKRTIEALRLLEQAYRRGDIYVTTTAKLLKYYVNKKYLNWHVKFTKHAVNIYIDNISDPVRGTFIPNLEDLSGITFYTNQPKKTHIFLAIDKNHYQEITDVVRNGPDYTGRKSIMIPIKHLKKIDSLMKIYHKEGLF